MTTDNPQPRGVERVPTGIVGLDTVLEGGLLRGGVYMVFGKPGAGKTILGSQFAFNHVARGGRAVFMTLLTETHSRLLGHLSGFEFFRADHVGTSLSLVSGYKVLGEGKLAALGLLVRQVIRDQKATVLVIDGLVTAGEMATSVLELKEFLHDLQVLTEMVGCTVLLLTGLATLDDYPQRTMVDGVLEIHLESSGLGRERSIEVTKFRGSDFRSARHLMEITSKGVTVHPRIEALFGSRFEQPQARRAHLAFDIPGLDDMLGAGVGPTSVTLLLGAAGTGKTLLGASFLAAGAARNEPGLYLGFSETPTELMRQTEGVNPALARSLASDCIDIVWQPPLRQNADALAAQLLANVRQRHVQRVFIDGLGEFRSAVLFEERTRRFFTSLCNELRTLGAATLISDQTPDIFGPQIAVSGENLTAMLDNIIVLRNVELQARLRRIITLMKKREGKSDSSLREFSIGKGGIQVSSTFESAEAVLSGVARLGAAAAPPGRRGPRKRRSKR